MTFVIIALCLIILTALIGLIGFLKQLRLERDFDKLVRAYLENYSKYKEVWDSDYDAETIVDVCKSDGNFLWFSNRFTILSYRDAKELRECMIVAGEFMIQYQRILQDYYAYQGKQEEIQKAYDALREIRRICLEKGENANFMINVKAAT